MSVISSAFLVTSINKWSCSTFRISTTRGWGALIFRINTISLKEPLFNVSDLYQTTTLLLAAAVHLRRVIDA